MEPAVVILFNFCCVTPLYVLLSIQQKDIHATAQRRNVFLGAVAPLRETKLMRRIPAVQESRIAGTEA